MNKIHPADRCVSEAIAHTIEEGGIWIEGPPKCPPGPAYLRGGKPKPYSEVHPFHTVIFADGWAYDTRVAELVPESRGARGGGWTGLPSVPTISPGKVWKNEM